MMLARASERIGYGSVGHAAHYAGKADILSRGQVLHGRPDAYKQEAEWVDAAGPHDIRQVTRRWLTTSVYKLRLDPFAATAIATGQMLDRSQPPAVSESPPPHFPTVHAARLQNGMRLRVVSQPGLNLTRLVLVFDGGVRADPPQLSGLTSVVMAMLAEGTQSYSAAGIRDRLNQLGTRLDVAIRPDASSLGVAVLSPHGGRALALLADLAIRPVFGTVAFELAKARAIGKAAQELRDEDVNPIAFKTLTRILYGRTNRYGRPLSGSGDPTTLGSLTREDLLRHQRAWLTPNNATLIAVGPRETAGWWADPDVLAGWLADAVALGFSEHHYAELSEAVRRVTVQQLNDVASTLRTSNPVLIVVGDRTQLEPQLRELRLGDVRVVPLADR